MSERNKIRVVVDEDATIVALLDKMAKAEGITRSDMMRRAIRNLISLPTLPTFGYNPKQETEKQAAA